jgi:hypothetical protein
VRSRGGSGEVVAAIGGVGFPPLRASGKWSRSSLLGQAPMNLGSRASYRHGGRSPLPTNLVATPPFKAPTDLWRETRTRFDRSGLRSIQQKKLDEWSRLMIFIWYNPGSKAYRAYDPLARCVHVSRDVVFAEQAQWDRAEGGKQGNTDTFSIKMEYMTTILGAPAEGGDHEAEQLPLSLQSPIQEEHLDVDHDDDAPIRVRSINEIMGPTSPRGLVPHILTAELHMVSSDE